jgi:hypothetical protein
MNLFLKDTIMARIYITSAVHDRAATMQRIVAGRALDPLQLVLITLDLKALLAMSLTVLVDDGLEGRAMSMSALFFLLQPTPLQRLRPLHQNNVPLKN